MYLQILPFETEDIDSILAWNENKGEDFLSQWAGHGYAYPLTYAQVFDKTKPTHEAQIYKIIRGDGDSVRMIGTVELNTACMPLRSAMVCRFLLDPAFQGRGYGECALILLSRMAFQELGFKKLRLKVFAYNKPAIRCYEKAGFKPCAEMNWTNGQKILVMENKKRRKLF